MSRLITEVKSFGKPALLTLVSVFVFTIFFSFPINVMAEEVPYWAGHKTLLWGTRGFILSISYSKDGKSYSANIEGIKWGSEAICEGKIDKKGNLEVQYCAPQGSKPSYLEGHVAKVILDYSGGAGAGGDVFVDEVLLERKTCGLKPCVVEVEKPLAKATRFAAAADQALALKRQKIETEKQALEERKRQDQDRQALVLERQKLETEKRAVAHSAEGPGAGFHKLPGPQMQRLFEEIGTVSSYPSDGNDFYAGGAEWNMNFQPNGTWEGTGGHSLLADAFGVWHVNGDMLCVEYKGVVSASSVWAYAGQPYEGCFAVYAKPDSGELAAEFPELGPKLIVLTTIAYSEIARAFGSKPAPTPQVTTRPSQRPPAAADQALALERQKLETEKRELERQRITLERDRLAQQKAMFEQEKRVLEQERRALARQREQAARRVVKAPVDRTPPTIDTAASITTNRVSATISGRVKDLSQIARLEVNGREVSFRSIDGRFSVKTPVAIGRNTVRIVAIDVYGNQVEKMVLVNRMRRIPKVDFGQYHALVIGIEDYKSLPKLKTAVGDAKAVAAVLREKYDFTVTALINPTRDEILDAFDSLAETMEKTDNLLIYYAGHGWLNERTGRGYWLPVNATATRKSRWFSNADLTDSLKEIQAKHVMVIADSCYSGTLTRSIKVPDRNPEYIARMAAKRTRVVLSSGGLEPVIDSGGGKHSVFANEFLKALDGNEAVMDGTSLFEQVRRRVVLNADQTPEYSDIRRAGHEGGDFLFVRRD